MSRSVSIIILALVTALFPHLGFPGYIKTSGVTLLSLGIALISYMAYREAKNQKAFPTDLVARMRIPSFKKEKKDSSIKTSETLYDETLVQE
ncbi:MAG: hypothetical protein HGA67_04480 [Candidatus Yonathbacteria bacterium]|nr:hypothetical protein [Candidatus Yonathbacteria bacterium]